jgi:hypothetical protein
MQKKIEKNKKTPPQVPKCEKCVFSSRFALCFYMSLDFLYKGHDFRKLSAAKSLSIGAKRVTPINVLVN